MNSHHSIILPAATTHVVNNTLKTTNQNSMTANHNNMQNGMYCRRCGYGGCDVRILGCGCSVHARCINTNNAPLTQCPYCMSPTSGLALYPMTFHEIDNARRTAAAQSKSKRAKKRKSNPDNNPMAFDGGENDCRIGRWTPEERALCDKLIDRFKAGDLPVIDGVKLNDFLASMLKSKQSRLTKKMKNANLSGKQFKKTNGYIADFEQCKQFSELEDAFFRSLTDPQEQASVRFHMQKEWREMFSAFCVNIGQPLDADAWLSSVEEMEKRESVVKDAARMARRKMMMGIALDQDTQNPDQGVFIERSNHQQITSSGNFATLPFEQDDFLSLLDEKPLSSVRGALGPSKGKPNAGVGTRHYWHYASPFLGKVISYIQRHGCPFEHVDAWVPSFVPDNEASEGSGTNNSSSCRLCFGGSATADVCIPPDGGGQAQLLPPDEQFNLLSFGDYSQKFSFNVGCGLPGRVYENGIPAWEQSVQNAPNQHFERCGGAQQWGIKTVVGIPVPSPNVGRIVVVVYSRHDRNKDQDLVGRLYDEFKKLVPSPKWKLVVDIGTPQNDQGNENDMMQALPLSENGSCNNDADQDKQLNDLVALLGECMPHDQNSAHYSYLSNFMSLRLMLLKPSPSTDELEQRGTLLSSFSSYLSSGRSKIDIAVMIARDYMFLKQQSQPKPSPRIQGIVPNNHSIFQSMEQFSLPIQSNSFTSNNLNHNSFVPFPTSQSHDSAAQQQFSVLSNAHQQRPISQQNDTIDSSNQNGTIIHTSSANGPRMNLEALNHNDVSINPNSTEVPNGGKAQS